MLVESSDSERGHPHTPTLPRVPELACENMPHVNLPVTLGICMAVSTRGLSLSRLPCDVPSDKRGGGGGGGLREVWKVWGCGWRCFPPCLSHTHTEGELD